ncbi:MAG: UDP-N-acetylmuramate--alanine ligase [Thermomicrobiales bacterium]|nr:UDP-N-acetylmuramate--alanine ligase [Thermomicrobiales bacterium]
MTPPTIAVLPPPPARIHIVGIGGIGLSGLAQILHSLGYTVSGSDANASAQTASLMAIGIPVALGHTDVERAAHADLVVSTRAVLLADTAEIRAASVAGVPVVKRGEVLAMLANARRCVAVAGSHGKSTTCGMLVTALRELGADPSYAVGAVIGATGTNAALADGDAMVVEADEFDYAFLWLSPEVAIVTNVEFDHPDIFPDQQSYDAAFAQFATKLRPGGTLVLAADDPGCARLQAKIATNLPGQVVTYGEGETSDWRLDRDAEGWQIKTPEGSLIRLAPAVPGRHNARNATAALAALAALGHDPATAATALTLFTGVGRRFEIKGEVGGVLVVDDYAHHPSEIRATLRAARDWYPDRRLWAVFQPHTFSRTKALLGDFAAAFADADEVMILDIYPARETDSLGISSANLRKLVPRECRAAGRPDEAAETLAAHVRDGDVVVTLGAGDITVVGPSLLQRLRDRIPV